MSIASINFVAGPVVKATRNGPLSMGEAVHVGPNALLGEVVRLTDTGCTIQIYEDTTGLRPGDSIEGSGLPLSVKLGPGLLGNIFDGLLRPLEPNTEAVR
ncbi:MAG: ATPase, partial [Deltaproteobacteria bacterium]|nr:ATPase [Candidatus Tharpella sp.]